MTQMTDDNADFDAANADNNNAAADINAVTKTTR